jgi:hypothetical protein
MWLICTWNQEEQLVIFDALKNHRVLLDSRSLNEQLLCAGANGLEPLTEWLKTITMPEEGKVLTIRTAFGHEDPGLTDFTKAFTLMNPLAMENRAWEEDFYSPLFSVGVMDKEGQVYPMHLRTFVDAGNYDWMDLPNGQHWRKECTLRTMMTSVMTKLLNKMMDPADNEQRALRVPIYRGENVGLNVAGNYLLLGQDRVHPILFVQMYMVVDKLKPMIHAESLEKALQAEDPEKAIAEATYVGVSTEAYREKFANPDLSKDTNVGDIIGKIVYGSMMPGWGEVIGRVFKQTPGSTFQHPVPV